MGTEPDPSQSPRAPGPVIGYASHNTPSAAQVARDFNRMHRQPIRLASELKAVLGIAAAMVVGLILGTGGKGGGGALMMPWVIGFAMWFVHLRLRTRKATPTLWRRIMFVASIGAIVFTATAVVQAEQLSYPALTTYPARFAVTLVAICVGLFALAEVAALIQRHLHHNAAASPTLPPGNAPS
jgi:hypothetical protein